MLSVVDSVMRYSLLLEHRMIVLGGRVSWLMTFDNEFRFFCCYGYGSHANLRNYLFVFLYILYRVYATWNSEKYHAIRRSLDSLVRAMSSIVQ